MAKTFKNLPNPSEVKASKPTSERDFFDLSDDTSLVKKPATIQQRSGNIDNTINSNNTGNTNNTGNKKRNKEGAAAAVPESSDGNEAMSSPGVRQTFVLSPGHLERLRDYVHVRRVEGEYNYSQRQALQEALDLLFATVGSVPPRPDKVREQQLQHGQRIRQGRQTGNSE